MQNTGPYLVVRTKFVISGDREMQMFLDDSFHVFLYFGIIVQLH